jgi:hypothetical protein
VGAQPLGSQARLSGSPRGGAAGSFRRQQKLGGASSGARDRSVKSADVKPARSVIEKRLPLRI